MEFVRLLANARMVFTDSFHVTAFSINFHIPFYVFNRNKVAHMTSRIESVCEVFGMQERYIPEQKRFSISESCDFRQADQQLLVERKKFFDYLDRCFQD